MSTLSYSAEPGGSLWNATQYNARRVQFCFCSQAQQSMVNRQIDPVSDDIYSARRVTSCLAGIRQCHQHSNIFNTANGPPRRLLLVRSCAWNFCYLLNIGLCSWTYIDNNCNVSALLLIDFYSSANRLLYKEVNVIITLTNSCYQCW